MDDKIIPSTSIVGKRERKSLSLETKLDILQRINAGDRQIDVCKALGLAGSTVRTIMKNKDVILEAAKVSVSLQARKLSRARPLIMIEMERLLDIFIEQNAQLGIMLSPTIIQEQAIIIYEDLKKLEPDKPQEPFTASKGWFDRFKRRSNFFSNQERVEDFKRELLEVLENGGYTAQQVFNIDETGLFWKRMPKGTLTCKEEESVPGFAAATDRLTLLLGGNAAGDFKLKPLLVYHSVEPKVLKGFAKSKLPVTWKANNKAWVTRTLFLDWYVEYFCPAVENYFMANDLTNKAVLIMDNAPGHPSKESLEDLNPNVKIVCVPQSITYLIQPMNQGLIAVFKANYIKRIFSQAVEYLNDDGTSQNLSDFWKSYTIKCAIYNISSAWEEVSQRTMNWVWSNIWKDCVYDNDGFGETVEMVIAQIVELAKEAGLNEIDPDEVQDLIDNDKDGLSSEELMAIGEDRKREVEEKYSDAADGEIIKSLTAKGLSEAFEHFEKMCAYFRENDPDMERSSKVIRGLQKSLNCYVTLYNKRKRSRVQYSNDI